MDVVGVKRLSQRVAEDVSEFADDDQILHDSDREEDTVDTDKKHAKLLDSISALDGQRRSKLSERTVLARNVSEYGFSQAGGEEKVRLHELVGSLQSTSSHGTLHKQLRAVQRRKQLASVPLSRVEETKIQRSTAYEKAKDDLAKWDTVVTENRKAEQIFFPLQQPSLRLQTTDEVVKRFKPRTPLEVEIAALLHANQDSVGTHDAELTPAEERALKAMNLEEARERRAELQKYRALMTYKQARAKQQKKIKSKKYHRILKKERLKQEKHNLEELQRTDPEAYIEKLQEIDRQRVEERMSQKHRGGSKFAKRQMIYGKYDERGREAIQEMIQKNKELTQKVKLSENDSGDSSDEGVAMESEDEANMIESELSLSRGDNPWMTSKPVTLKAIPKKECDSVVSEVISVDTNKGNENSEKKSKKRKAVKKSSDVDSVSKDASDSKKSKLSVDVDELFDNLRMSRRKLAEEIQSEADKQKNSAGKKKKKRRKKKKLEEEKSISKKKKKKVVEESSNSDDDEPSVSQSLTRKQTLEDLEGNWSDEDNEKTKKARSTGKETPKMSLNTQKSKVDDAVIDPKKLLCFETKIVMSANVDIVTDEDGEMDAEEQQRMTIAQAFAEDDVVDEFSREKAEVVQQDAPKSIDLTLPGWGDWGGTGILPSKKKRKRFTLKAPKARQRRDKGLKHVIISEKLDNSIAKYQVAKLPFPYKSPQQFEQSIQAPIGKTWNPETAFRKLIRPKVVTKMGTVIQPIDRSDVFKKKKTKTEREDGMDVEEEGHGEGVSQRRGPKHRRKGRK